MKGNEISPLFLHVYILIKRKRGWKINQSVFTMVPRLLFY